MTVQAKCKQCGRLMEWDIDNNPESIRMMKMLLAVGVTCDRCSAPVPRQRELPERIGKECATGERET